MSSGATSPVRRPHPNQSAPGKGTRFTLVIPLTLAVLDGMLVAAGEEKFILPLSSIVESIRPDKKQVRMLTGGTQVASIRGEYIRLISLHRVIDTPARFPPLGKRSWWSSRTRTARRRPRGR